MTQNSQPPRQENKSKAERIAALLDLAEAQFTVTRIAQLIPPQQPPRDDEND